MGGKSSSSSSNPTTTTTVSANANLAPVLNVSGGGTKSTTTVQVTDNGAVKQALDFATAGLANELNFANGAGLIASDLVSKALGLVAASNAQSAPATAIIASAPTNVPAQIAAVNNGFTVQNIAPYAIAGIILYGIFHWGFKK